MKLVNGDHVVDTSNAVEQVNLKARGYVEVAEYVAPVPTPKTAPNTKKNKEESEND